MLALWATDWLKYFTSRKELSARWLHQGYCLFQRHFLFADTVSLHREINICGWYNVCCYYEPKHWNLQGHSSLIPIYLYIQSLTFDVLSTKNSSLQFDISKALNRSYWTLHLGMMHWWPIVFDPRISVSEVHVLAFDSAIYFQSIQFIWKYFLNHL